MSAKTMSNVEDTNNYGRFLRKWTNSSGFLVKQLFLAKLLKELNTLANSLKEQEKPVPKSIDFKNQSRYKKPDEKALSELKLSDNWNFTIFQGNNRNFVVYYTH